MRGSANVRGFTVIEVMLFLAISGLMMVGMLVGVSGSINRQRYDDAVSSFQDYMQGQYNLAGNTRNARSDAYICTPGSISDIGTQRVGTSDCTIVGRIIQSTDGEKIISRPIFATAATYDTTGTEQDLLASMNMLIPPSTLTSNDDDYNMAWQTKIFTNPADRNNSRHFNLLIIRLPVSGVVRTYATTTPYTNLQDIWSAAQVDTNLCIQPDGLTGAQPNGVRVRAQAANSSGVQFISASDGACA